jgi:1-acyl-sn-glycerol-3-phosphate acyltransferase
LFDSALLGPILRAWQVIPLDREGGTGSGLKAIIDRLKSGGAVLLFPEGTRSRDGQLQKARSGIGLVVIKSGAPVVPVRIFGTFEAMGRQARFPRPTRVTLKYGRPLRFEALHAEARTCPKPRLKEIYQQVADEIMAAIAELEPRPDAANDPETATSRQAAQDRDPRRANS